MIIEIYVFYNFMVNKCVLHTMWTLISSMLCDEISTFIKLWIAWKTVKFQCHHFAKLHDIFATSSQLELWFGIGVSILNHEEKEQPINDLKLEINKAYL